MLRIAERSHNRVTTWFHMKAQDGVSPAESCAEFNDVVTDLFITLGYPCVYSESEFRTYICRLTCGMYRSGSARHVPFPKHPPIKNNEWSPSYDSHWHDWIRSRALPSYDELWSSIPVRTWEYDGWRSTLWSILPYCIRKDEALYLSTVIPYEDEELKEEGPVQEVRAD